MRADVSRLTHASPVIVELVGPAGSGKTTLSHLLSAVASEVRIGPDIELRKMGQLPLFFRHMPAWMPFYFKGGAARRSLSWEELKYITYLKAWPGLLRKPENRGKVMLLDHGPIFRLATLLAFGPDSLRKLEHRDWWERLYRQWAFNIDIIVWLDTDDETLIERINDRNQKHVMKGRRSTEAREFVVRYRMAYLRTLRSLMDHRQPRLLQFDTGEKPVEIIAGEVLAACRE